MTTINYKKKRILQRPTLGPRNVFEEFRLLCFNVSLTALKQQKIKFDKRGYASFKRLYLFYV